MRSSHLQNTLAALCGLAFCVLLNAAKAQTTTATTDPVGFITLTVAGTGGGTTPAYTYLGLGMTQPVLFQGAVDALGTKTITNNEAGWTDNQFNGTGNACFVEFTSGANAGVTIDISATTASTKSITTVQNIPAGTSVGDTFKIRQHWTIGTVFGATDQSGLAGGSSTTADLVFLYNGSGYDVYYYQTVGLGGTGWRKGGSAGDASNTVIYGDEGLIVKRNQASNLNIVLMGAVKTGQTSVPITSGVNFVGNVYAASLTLGDSGLYTGNASTGIAGGSSTTADLVYIWNGTGYNIYYYQTVGLGGTGWRQAGVAGDASGAPIPVGAAVLVKRQSGSGFNWIIPQHPSSI